MTTVDLINEKPFKPKSGWPFLAILPTILIFGVCQLIYNVTQGSPALLVLGILTQVLCVVVFIISLCGFQALQPNNARVLILSGIHKGTIRDSGCFWVNPFYSKRKLSLPANTELIGEQLRQDIQDRLNKAGVQVLEARISHLAYAQEIAAAMLQRQQAQAVVAARTKIVDGAVGMVQMALERLRENGIVELDDERRAAMVSNLLVVLCGDRSAQPVVNTGTLHN